MPHPDDGGDQVDWRRVAESLFQGCDPYATFDTGTLQLLEDARLRADVRHRSDVALAAIWAERRRLS